MWGKASLTYYIFEGLLVGTVNGKSVHILAACGGRAGSKTEGVVDGHVANNPYQTPRKIPPYPTGGPLPTGVYSIDKPLPNYKGNGPWAHLHPRPGNQMFGRVKFAIHGRGPRGSDGCIVPLHPHEFHHLMDGLEADGGGTLVVCDAIGGSLV